jgi:hypothetical protein
VTREQLRQLGVLKYAGALVFGRSDAISYRACLLIGNSIDGSGAPAVRRPTEKETTDSLMRLACAASVITDLVRFRVVERLVACVSSLATTPQTRNAAVWALSRCCADSAPVRSVLISAVV